jgi:hypothetical protein
MLDITNDYSVNYIIINCENDLPLHACQYTSGKQDGRQKSNVKKSKSFI